MVSDVDGALTLSMRDALCPMRNLACRAAALQAVQRIGDDAYKVALNQVGPERKACDAASGSLSMCAGDESA